LQDSQQPIFNEIADFASCFASSPTVSNSRYSKNWEKSLWQRFI